jgi:uncharacterized protein involved in response to NO
MAAIPRYRPQAGPAVLSAGFRPFFLVSALWAFLVIPIWIAFFCRAWSSADSASAGCLACT